MTGCECTVAGVLGSMSVPEWLILGLAVILLLASLQDLHDRVSAMEMQARRGRSRERAS